MARIRVKKVPNAVPNQTAPGFDARRMQKPSFETGRVLKGVPREDANIEAEAGETALMPNKNGLPAHFNIQGSRHTNGGTPLNVPKDTFIFSDTKKMRIKDPEILAEFGKSKGSYTPADLAKKYDLNKYRKLLQDPDSDKLQVKTAEKMIENYNLKLAKLALVQESKKGFPQGIPAVAMPFLSTYNVEPDQILPLKDNEQQENMPQMRFGGSFQGGGQTDQFADLDKQLQAIINKNKKAQEDALKKLQEEKDQQKKAHAQQIYLSTSKGIDNTKYKVQNLFQQASSTPAGMVQDRMLYQISTLIKQLRDATESLPYVSNPKNYSYSGTIHSLPAYNYTPQEAGALPKPVTPVWNQNSDKSWTQANTFTPPIIASPPSASNKVNAFNRAQQSMMNFPGSHPYIDTIPQVGPPTAADTIPVRIKSVPNQKPTYDYNF